MRRSYSYSKRETLDTCSRRYFYEYYAAAKAVPFDPDRKAAVASLKAMTNRHMLAGHILHSLIELRFKRGRDWPVTWFIRTAGDRFAEAVTYSRGRSCASGKFTPPLLAEIVCEDEDADDSIAQARQRMTTSLSNFFSDPGIAAIWRVACAGSYVAEQRLSGLKLGEYTVDGKVDLVGHGADGIHIIDWKMGEAEVTDESLQLFTYGWWASNSHGEPLERIRAQKVFLAGPTVSQPIALNSALMRRGKARMFQDIELIKDLDPYGREGNEEAFTPCNRPNVCRQCNYRGICSAGLFLKTSRPTFRSLPALQATG